MHFPYRSTALRSRLRHGVVACVLLAGVVFRPAQAAELSLSHLVGDWPPLVDFKAPNQGALSRQVREVWAHAGVTMALQEASWKAVEVALDAGQTNSFGWIHTEDRARRWLYSDPLCDSPTIFVTRKDHPPAWRRIEDLAGRRVGWSRGYRYGDGIDAYRDRFEIIEMATDEVALRHLAAGTVDLMPMDMAVASHLMNNVLPPEVARKLALDDEPAHVLNRQALHFVCSRADEGCTGRIGSFNAALRKWRGKRPLGVCGLP